MHDLGWLGAALALVDELHVDLRLVDALLHARRRWSRRPPAPRAGGRSSASTACTDGVRLRPRVLPSGGFSQTLNSLRSSRVTKSSGTPRATAMPPTTAASASATTSAAVREPPRQHAPVVRLEPVVARLRAAGSTPRLARLQRAGSASTASASASARPASRRARRRPPPGRTRGRSGRRRRP